MKFFISKVIFACDELIIEKEKLNEIEKIIEKIIDKILYFVVAKIIHKYLLSKICL